MGYYKKTDIFTVGQSTTGSIMLNEKLLCGIIISASTITGAKITFLASSDGLNYYPVYDKLGYEVGVTTGSFSAACGLDTESFFPWNIIKARLGTSASPVNQAGSDTPIEFILRST